MQSFEHEITLQKFEIKFINWCHNIQILPIIVATSMEFLEYDEAQNILPEMMKTQSNFLNLRFVLPSSYIMTYQIASSFISNSQLVQYVYEISKFLQYIFVKWKNEIEKRARIFIPCVLYKKINFFVH